MYSEKQMKLTEYLESGEGRRHLLAFREKYGRDDLDWALKFIKDYEKKHKVTKKNMSDILEG